jgi:hypothetical protein
MARQITLTDRAIFRLIKVSTNMVVSKSFEQPLELLDTAWSSPVLKYRAKNVLDMISMFNQRSYWVQSVIVTTTKWKNRVKVFERFIKIAQVNRCTHYLIVSRNCESSTTSAPCFLSLAR